MAARVLTSLPEQPPPPCPPARGQDAADGMGRPPPREGQPAFGWGRLGGSFSVGRAHFTHSHHPGPGADVTCGLVPLMDRPGTCQATGEPMRPGDSGPPAERGQTPKGGLCSLGRGVHSEAGGASPRLLPGNPLLQGLQTKYFVQQRTPNILV